MDPQKNLPTAPGFWKMVRASLRWTRTSFWMLSAFLALLGLIGYVWWPLVTAYLSTYNPDYPFWMQIDYLLIWDFLLMTLLIMANADLRRDWLIFAIGMCGGLVIESWGTQTNLWFYYTAERPPLWIIPAWPIASLSIDRLFRMLRLWTGRLPERLFQWIYWVVFPAFYGLMFFFVRFTLDKSLTLMALFLVAFLILTTKDKRSAVLVFTAGSGLGYFLELWGTTRQCWTYYTWQTPPFFAVLAHGMAAVAFWRVWELFWVFAPGLRRRAGRLFKAQTGRNRHLDHAAGELELVVDGDDAVVHGQE